MSTLKYLDVLNFHHMTKPDISAELLRYWIHAQVEDLKFARWWMIQSLARCIELEPYFCSV